MTNAQFYPDTVPIIFASDNNYLPYMSATIQSVMENSSQNRKYIFYVLHKEIRAETMDLLKKQVSLFPQFSIEFINVSHYMSKYNLFISRHITVETYFRFLIPELFAEYKKVIYLDCDMILCADIAELFDINLENHLLAAMRDIDVANGCYSPEYSEDKKKFSHRQLLSELKNPGEYFCAGMCVFNIELFRKTISVDELFEIAVSRKWDYHDQDILNYVAEGKIFLLSYHWGFYNTNLTKHLPKYLQNEYIDAEKNPKIIHFIRKPWTRQTYMPHFESFWKYATRTPFIDVIIERMKSNGFIPKEISFEKIIISNIKQREGIGIKFILFDCIKAWLFREKQKKI